ncbi:MAG: RNA 3'-terminal phosphate cyclase [Gemmatimonadota bacterium]|nr:MAG: RNA 3'-terminal phosphate cyclase [Gemmatimonadota bacterium]
MIEIDGSYGEGGGAIFRQALGMAMYATKPVRIRNIRAGRRKAGLAAQHLKAVEAAGAVSGARVRGANLGSTEVVFDPGPVRPGEFSLDVGTAGSTTLILQTVLLPCLFLPGEFSFDLTGGTDVPWSPPADYLANVTLRTLQPFGIGRLEVLRRGYYPKGGGVLRARLVGGSGFGFALKFPAPGEIKVIRGVSHATNQLRERGVAERQADAAEHLLERLGCPVEIAVEYSEAANLGSGITLWTESDSGPPIGGSGLGAKGKPADDVGREAARTLLDELNAGAAVDRHLADQLIPFLAVSGGSLVTSGITAHTRSTIYVAEQILGAEFEVEGLAITARR